MKTCCRSPRGDADFRFELRGMQAAESHVVFARSGQKVSSRSAAGLTRKTTSWF